MINILQLTDPHIFEGASDELYGVNTQVSLQAVLDDIEKRALDCDAVLVTGDLVHDAGKKAYETLNGMMSRFNDSVHYLPGNHDTAALLHQCLPNSPDDNVYSFKQGSWLIVMLDSSVEGEVGGQLSASILAELDALLETYSQCHTLIAVHHQPVKVGSGWMDSIGLLNGEELLAKLKRHAQVKLVINGHIHQETSANVGHIRVLGTPSTCAQFKPKSEEAGIDDAPPGYRYLQLHDNGDFDTEVFWL